MTDIVDGIEVDPTMAELASRIYHKVFIMNLDDLGDSSFLKSKYNVILLGDVLEHTRNPKETLKYLVDNCLSSGGYVLISLPNIGHLETFVNVYLRREWPRNTRGIFDETHISWFTWKNVENMLSYTRLKLIERKQNYRLTDKLNQGEPGFLKSLIFRLLIKTYPSLVTFQFLIKAEKCSS